MLVSTQKLSPLRGIWVFILIVTCLLIASGPLSANDDDDDDDDYTGPVVDVPVVSDLQKLAHSARAKRLPIVLVYSAEDCEHCERLEQDLLGPMLLSGELNNQAILRKFMVDAIESITDFTGKQQDAEGFSMLHNVDVTPTIHFVDADGAELVPPMVGYQGVDMYLAYLNAAISTSKLIVSSRKN